MDMQEIEAGRNPIEPDALSNYYVQIPANGYLQYPAEEMELSGTIVFSAWIRLAKTDVTKSLIIASRKGDVSGDQFKLELVNGVPMFTVGDTFVKANKAIKPGKGDFVWFFLTATRTDEKLILGVVED